MSAELTAKSDTARYSNSSSFRRGVESKGGEARYFLSFWNDFSHSFNHSKDFEEGQGSVSCSGDKSVQCENPSC